MPKLKDLVVAILYSLIFFIIVLTVIQIAYLFGYYEETFAPAVYVAAVFGVLFYVWANKKINALIKLL
ncbi:hypothetical protein [Pedobacter sandarakinus]|uniref:hypothetical protein n=1 Tax=Pedobacter sandarakinus TaxID=353156 RepID=UPI002245E158|nr:hypothetical protein [Pedobacter sandarakinus]MCX2575523.1 hypothetical protein [Pedobacter sandarakinus]